MLANVSALRGEESKPAELDSLILYVPTPDLPARLGSDVEPLTAYLKSLEKVIVKTFESGAKPSAKGLLVAVGIKGGKKARVWCEAVEGECPAKLLRKLETVLAAEPSIAVRKPPVAFGMKMRLWGRKPQKFPEFPEVWVTAAKETETKLLIPPDDLFEHIWPDKSKEDAVGLPSPGFVWQVLNPLGGEIQRPKGWFYTESHRAPSYSWILSREDASKGPYTTGMRIQMIVGVQEKTGKSPKEFVLDFAKKKKVDAEKVVKSCSETERETFTRMCLETEEGPHHILYSLFWGNKIDMVVVSISGTTKELWEMYSSTFDEMSDFRLLDMKQIEK